MMNAKELTNLAHKTNNWSEMKSKIYLGIAPVTKETEIVKKEYLDLEVYVYVRVNEYTTFKLQKSMVDNLGIIEEEAFAIATLNSLKEIELQRMEDFFELFGDAVDDFGMVIMSNKIKIRGAIGMYFKGILKSVARQIGTNKLYIIPSSIHEVLLIADDIDVTILNTMITDINSSEVSEKERLSNHAYIYSLEKDEITY